MLDSLKRLEYEGYHFEVADGSLELLLRSATGWSQTFFELESYRVIADQGGRPVHRGHRQGAGGRRADRGHGRGQRTGQRPRRRAAGGHRCHATRRWRGVHLVDYRVRVLDSAKGTGSVTRVLIDSTDGDRTWTTIGVSENIIAASWQALCDSIVYGLLHAAVEPELDTCPRHGTFPRSRGPCTGRTPVTRSTR